MIASTSNIPFRRLAISLLWLAATIVMLPIALGVTLVAWAAFVMRPLVAGIATCVTIVGGLVALWFGWEHQWSNALRAGGLAVGSMVVVWGCEWLGDRVGRHGPLMLFPPWWWTV